MYKYNFINNENYLNNNSFNEDYFLKNESIKYYVNEDLIMTKEIGIEYLKTSTSLNQPNEILNYKESNNLNLNNSNEIQINILDNIHRKKKNSLKKNNLGRKRKNSNIKGKHNKYSQDNIIKKIKSSLISILYRYINSFIIKIYKGKIGYGVFKKQLLTINQSQIVNVKNNKKFLYKNLKDIFSDNITGKYSTYHINHNKILIQNLLNEEDEEKKIKFNNLFTLTFIDCLNHFIREKEIDILNGIEYLDDFCKKFEDDKDYIELFKYYAQNLEKIVLSKKERNRH